MGRDDSEAKNIATYRFGGDFLEAIKGLIATARQEILISIYTFSADACGRDFMRLMGEAAQRGVHVKIVFDAFGSRHQEYRVLKKLKRLGVEARVFRPFPSILFRHPLRFLCRDHARIFLFDRRRLVLGGAGIGKIYQNREDFSLATNVQGSAEIVRYFDYLWALAEVPQSDLDPIARWPVDHGSSGAQNLSFMISGPQEREQEIYRQVLSACLRAQERIVIMTPFFFPTAELLAAVVQARKRGVKVEVITPLRTDKPYYDSFRAMPAPILRTAGAQWWGVRHYFHQKIFIADDYWTIGSANFDVISMKRNYELNIYGKGGGILSLLDTIIDEKKNLKNSTQKLPSAYFYEKFSWLIYPCLEFLFALT